MTKHNAHTTHRRRGRIGVIAGLGMTAAVIFSLMGSVLGAVPQSSEYTCFPTCGVDGRFLVVTGNDPTTLAAAQVVIGLNFPAAGGSTRGDFDLFDGDRDATRWDVKYTPTSAAPPELEIELYADPAGTGTSGSLVKKWAAGEITFANSDWTGVTWPHAAGALSAPGPDQAYRYSLKISPALPAEDLGWNAFKVRTHGTIQLPSQVFGFIGSLVVPGDLPSIYPNYPNLSGSSYDGSWSFKFRVPAGAGNVTIFDGDFDYGDAACTINDTDDRDTTGVPAFAAGATAEGVAVTGLPCSTGTGSRTGLPAEDNTGAAFKRVPTQAGAAKGLVYRVVAPDGQVFLNRNPSGNKEWEQFKILKVAGAGTTGCPAAGFRDHDCETATLPEGLWEIQVDGMDMSNLNFFYLNFKIER
jgi:hypothetical protein